MGNRGVSNVIAVVLLAGIVVAGGTILVYAGSAALDQRQTDAEIKTAVTAMQTLDKTIEQAASSDQATWTVDFSAPSDDLTVTATSSDPVEAGRVDVKVSGQPQDILAVQSEHVRALPWCCIVVWRRKDGSSDEVCASFDGERGYVATGRFGVRCPDNGRHEHEESDQYQEPVPSIVRRDDDVRASTTLHESRMRPVPDRGPPARTPPRRHPVCRT